MRTVAIDGRRMRGRDAAHEYLSKKPFAPSHYGKNLDALYDALTSWGEEARVVIRYPGAIERNLGAYGAKLIAVFEAAARENPRIALVICRGKGGCENA